MEAIDRDLAAQNEELETVQNRIQRLSASAEGITKRYLELRTKQSGLLADIAGKQADVASLEGATAQAQSRIDDLNRDLEAGGQRWAQAQRALDDCLKSLEGARGRVQTASNTIAGYELRQSGRVQRRDGLREELRRCTTQLDAVSAKARVYRAMELDYDSYNKSVRSIMQESRRGSLPNIHGPVSRLIHTEDAFTTAIEIALGAAMQQIVVGTEADAKAAIGYLKRTGNGRATFLPLNAITPRYLQESGVESCRGFVGIASRLVQCQDTYRAVVDNLLGRIVIVEDRKSVV